MSVTPVASSGRNALSSMCRSCRHARSRQNAPRHSQRHIQRRALSSTSSAQATNPLSDLNEDLKNDPKEEETPSIPAEPTPQSRYPNAEFFKALRSKSAEQLAANQAAKAEQDAALNDILFGSGSKSNSSDQSRSSSSTTNKTIPSRRNAPNAPSSTISNLFSSARNESSSRLGTSGTPPDEPYHIHVYAHKHNTHVTFTEPSRNPILSFSCGNIGLRKAQRASFDAAYQLATYSMKKMAMASWRSGGSKMKQDALQNPQKTIRDVEGIEVIMRGFGPGREAFQKALLGSEGSLIRPLVKRVSDATRLKFGGARSPNVRRL